jgi:hypothetical protein
MKIRVKLPDGKIEERTARLTPFGNFVMVEVLYNRRWITVGDGDEYLHGYDKVFEIRRR